MKAVMAVSALVMAAGLAGMFQRLRQAATKDGNMILTQGKTGDRQTPGSSVIKMRKAITARSTAIRFQLSNANHRTPAIARL